MYCVKYSNRIIDEFGNNVAPIYTGFFKPFSAVRDDNTYSLTYLPTSVIWGIEDELKIPAGSIKRHRLTFEKSGMLAEQMKNTLGEYWVNGEPVKYTIRDGSASIGKFHLLVNPEIILGFNRLEDAEVAAFSSLYAGRTEYLLYPAIWNGERIVEMSENEFDNLPGVETFPSDDNGVFCGFNRFDGNRKQYVNIVRNEWN